MDPMCSPLYALLPLKMLSSCGVCLKAEKCGSVKFYYGSKSWLQWPLEEKWEHEGFKQHQDVSQMSRASHWNKVSKPVKSEEGKKDELQLISNDKDACGECTLTYILLKWGANARINTMTCSKRERVVHGKNGWFYCCLTRELIKAI